MSKLLALMFMLSILVTIHVCVLMFGWGLEPKSWAWIIGGGVFAQMAAKMILDAVWKEK